MRIKLQIPASLKHLDALCRTVEDLQEPLMCTDRQMFEIVLVLEELIANVIRHGDGSSIEVELEKEWEELVITIRDDGGRFDPTMVEPPDTGLPLEQRAAGGLGIHLAGHYTDSFTYRRENEKNIVTLKKRI